MTIVLKHSEIRFWQEMLREVFSRSRYCGLKECILWADEAVRALRLRTDETEPRPDEGRL